jgi:transposase
MSKLTRDLIDRVCDVVARGNFRKTAFAMHGVPLNTWKHWVTVGRCIAAGQKVPGTSKPSEEHMELCAELSHRLDYVEANVEVEAVADILAQSKSDWKAAAWYLERRHNKKFSRNPVAHWDDEEAMEIKIDAKELLRDRLERLVSRLQDEE